MLCKAFGKKEEKKLSTKTRGNLIKTWLSQCVG